MKALDYYVSEIARLNVLIGQLVEERDDLKAKLNAANLECEQLKNGSAQHASES